MSEIVIIDRNPPLDERAPAIISLDKGLTVVDHTPSWLQYIHSERESVVGHHIYHLLPKAKKQLEPLLEKALAGSSAQRTPLHLSIQDRMAYWDVSVEPRRDKHGDVRRVLLIAYEITDEKQLRQQLEQVVADRTRKLEALYTIASIAAERVTLQAALQRSLQAVFDTGLGNGVMIHLWDEATQTAQMAAQLNTPLPKIQPAARQQVENKLIHICIEQRKTIILDDIRHNEQIPEVVRQSGIISIADVPMLPKGRTVGVLSVFRQTENRFTVNDIDLLEAVADQVGAIIQATNLQQDHDLLLLQDERRRLADQLHDAVTQSLYSLTLYAGAIQQFAVNGELEKSLPYIEPLQTTAQRALREMRLMLHNLRPLALAHDGLVEALRQRFNAVERRANMQGQVINETEIVLAPNVEEQLYYIASEALNNALKHANASRVSVVLEQSADSLIMTIIDDGSGFQLSEGEAAGGSGLRSMRERAETLGGTLTLTPSTAGTTLKIAVPLTTALRSITQ
jgi:signal transduction histidine kinase